MSGLHLAFQLMLLTWIALVVLCVRRTIAAGSVGLPAAFLLSMSFLYGGAFVYAVPGYTHLRADGHWYLKILDFSEHMVLEGTFASLLGVLGFVVGCGVFGTRRGRAHRPMPPVRRPPSYTRRVLLILGAVALASFALHFAGVSFPMSGAVLEAGRNLALSVICLGAASAVLNGRGYRGWIVLAALVPAYYLVGLGFTSYGFLFVTILLCFWLAVLKMPRRTAWPVAWGLALVVCYLALTLFMAWMSFREELRLIVWQPENDGSIVDVALRALQGIEPFSPWDFHALDLINIRLDLPLFVGRMIDWHARHPELREHGATLIIIPLVFLPHFIWPGKPERGGSGFMEHHTGMILSDETTFGTGSVFEFFVNFGYVGVFVGFLLLGLIISRIDRRAARSLASGNHLDFARWFAVGVVAVDPLVRPLFIVNGGLMTWLLTSLLIVVVRKPLRRGPRARATAEGGQFPSVAPVQAGSMAGR